MNQLCTGSDAFNCMKLVKQTGCCVGLSYLNLRMCLSWSWWLLSLCIIFLASFSIECDQWKYLKDEATDYAYCHNARIQATPPLIIGCVAVVQQLAREHLGCFWRKRFGSSENVRKRHTQKISIHNMSFCLCLLPEECFSFLETWWDILESLGVYIDTPSLTQGHVARLDKRQTHGKH